MAKSDTRASPPRPNQLRDCLRSGRFAVTAEMPLVIRPDLRAELRSAGDKVTLSFLSTGVTWPGYCGDALARVVTGNVFTAAELPGLSEDDRLLLVRRLLREGIVVPAEAAVAARG